MEYGGAVHLPLSPTPNLHHVSHLTIFVKKIDHNIVPPPLPPKNVFSLTEQWFMKAEECFDLNDSDDDDFLFFKPSPSRQSSSIQHYHQQVEVNVQGTGKMVVALVQLKILYQLLSGQLAQLSVHVYISLSVFIPTFSLRIVDLYPIICYLYGTFILIRPAKEVILLKSTAKRKRSPTQIRLSTG
ncbi:hypothetical protein EDD85DRAFT_958618 [Armillaria nabsnona]|nr:hypothetical protein EDD85DRAFT_958618 [Armillaria nabsnona]